MLALLPASLPEEPVAAVATAAAAATLLLLLLLEPRLQWLLLVPPLAFASLASLALAPESLQQLRVLPIDLRVDRLQLRAEGAEACLESLDSRAKLPPELCSLLVGSRVCIASHQ